MNELFTAIKGIFYPYLKSRHRATYEELAFAYKISPTRVYKLAHGDKPRSQAEKDAREDLKGIGIIRTR